MIKYMVIAVVAKTYKQDILKKKNSLQLWEKQLKKVK